MVAAFNFLCVPAGSTAINARNYIRSVGHGNYCLGNNRIKQITIGTVFKAWSYNS